MAGRIVAITGANSLTGRRLLPRLRDASWHTIALVRAPIDLPADEVVADWMNASAALAALERSDAIVHLPGALQEKSERGFIAANVSPAHRVAEALRRGRARRVVYSSYLGAGERSRNLYLRTKGIAERLLRESNKEAVLLRIASILDDPETPGPLEIAYTVPEGGTVILLGTGRQRLRPIHRADVVETIAAALERGRPGTYDLVGPEELSADDLARLVNRGKRIRIVHATGSFAWLLGRLHPRLNPHMAEIFMADGTGDPRPAQEEFGVRFRSLRQAWGG